MAEKLTDDEIRDLIMAMWSLTRDERGNPYQAHTKAGQTVLDMLARIAGVSLVLDIKKAEIVNLDDHRKPPRPGS